MIFKQFFLWYLFKHITFHLKKTKNFMLFRYDFGVINYYLLRVEKLKSEKKTNFLYITYKTLFSSKNQIILIMIPFATKNPKLFNLVVNLNYLIFVLCTACNQNPTISRRTLTFFILRTLLPQQKKNTLNHLHQNNTSINTTYIYHILKKKSQAKPSQRDIMYKFILCS